MELYSKQYWNNWLMIWKTIHPNGLTNVQVKSMPGMDSKSICEFVHKHSGLSQPGDISVLEEVKCVFWILADPSDHFICPRISCPVEDILGHLHGSYVIWLFLEYMGYRGRMSAHQQWIYSGESLVLPPGEKRNQPTTWCK